MDTTIIVAFIMGGLGLLGVFMTVLGNNSKTKSDSRTALEERIDKKVGEYMDDLEERLTAAADQIKELVQRADDLEARAEAAEAENKKLHKEIEELQAERHLADAREVLMYQYTKLLRDHIMGGNPPPPPTIPVDLVGWFQQFDINRHESDE